VTGAETLLKQIDLFKGLTASNLKELAGACLYQTFAKRGLLFVEGSRGKHIYILERGSVQLHKTAPDGKEIIIKTVKPGDLFAEVILFERDTYPVTAVAAQKSYLYLIPKIKIHTLLNASEFRRNFIQGLLEKHRYLTNRLLYLSAHDVENRFCLH